MNRNGGELSKLVVHISDHTGSASVVIHEAKAGEKK